MMQLEQAEAHKALAFFLNSTELQGMFQDWPQPMHLALCLREDGSCQVILYREEEGRRFLPRLQRVLGLRISEICFVPEIEGLPSRKLLFSEEKQLLALVRSSPDLAEEAIDYSENFTFALEEGLDPIRFLENQRNTQRRQDAPSIPEESKVETRPVRHDTSVDGQASMQHRAQSVEQNSLASAPEPEQKKLTTAVPKFMRVDEALEPGRGFQSVDCLRHSTTLPQQGLIETDREGWLVLRFPGCFGGQMTVDNPGRIFVSDNWRVLAIHSPFLGESAASVPERVLIGLGRVPAAIRDTISQSAGEVEVSFSEGFVFVHLKETTESASSDVVEPSSRFSLFKAVPRRLWMFVGVAVVSTLFFTGFQIGLSPSRTTADDLGLIDWNAYRTRSAESLPAWHVRLRDDRKSPTGG